MPTTYYLDTSAVRRFSSRLNQIETPDRVFKTSALTVSELVNGILACDKEFKSRRAALTALLSLKSCEIEWTLPDRPLALCFSEIEKNYTFTDKRPSSLQQLAQCITTSSDRDDFKTKESKLKLDFGRPYFEEYDTNFGDALIQMNRQGNPQVRDAFEKAKAGQLVTQVPREILDAGYSKFCEWFSIECRKSNESITIHGLALRAANDVTSRPTEDFIGRIYNSYDGSIDAFISAFSKTAMSIGTMGRNEALDLAHLLFVRKDWILVTNDKKMLNSARAVGLSTVTTSDLLLVQPQSTTI
nr:hypothetical protein MFMH1_34240 [Myxococcus sp. MH1]